MLPHQRETVARSMKLRIHIIGLFLLVVRVINIESHPRHDRNDDTRLSNNNKLLTDFSDDVVSSLFPSFLLSSSLINIINLREEHCTCRNNLLNASGASIINFR